MMNRAMREGAVLPGSFCGRYKVPYGFIFLLAMLFTFTLYGQEGNNITGNFYMTKVDIPVFQYDIFTQEIQEKRLADEDSLDGAGANTEDGAPNIRIVNPNVFYVAQAGIKFTAIETRDKYVIIRFWEFTNPTEGEMNFGGNERYRYLGRENNHMYFAIPVEDFNSKTKLYFGYSDSFTW